MEKYILKSACFILTIVILSSAGRAYTQDKHISRTIKIQNGDTVINGKHLKEYGKAEKESLLKEMREIRKSTERWNSTHTPNAMAWSSDTGKNVRKYFFRHKTGKNKNFDFNTDSLVLRFNKDSLLKSFSFNGDSIRKRIWENIFIERFDNSIDMPNIIVKRFPGIHADGSELPRVWGDTRKNSQSYDFTNTDKDGITSRIMINVNDPSPMQVEKIMSTSSHDLLNIQGLSFTPNFSTGKINLQFTLTSKGTTRVKILDSSYKEVLAESISGLSGNYAKLVAIPNNGIYYLVISQNNKSFIKRIVKQN